MKYRLLLSFILFTFLFVFAEIPTGYYDGTEGLSGDALKAAVNDAISTNSDMGYSSARAAMYSNIDNFNNTVRCVYTGKDYSHTAGNTSSPGDINCEHTFAQSWGATGIKKSDVHHLFPTRSTVNSSRGSLPFDVVSNHSSANVYHDENDYYSYRGSNSSGTTVWEPADQHKGNLARALLYFNTRYGDSLTRSGVNMVSVLLTWHLSDPVDANEISRNDKAYDFQGNRNPFVDHPEFVGYIWEGEMPNDDTPPLISNVFTSSATQIVVEFNENVDETTSQTISNYSVNNGIGNPISAVRGYNGYNKNVLLTISDLTLSQNYTITISNVEDLSENVISANSQVTFTYLEITELLIAGFESINHGWQTISISSDLDWQRTDGGESNMPSSAAEGSYYMYMNNYNGDAASEEWLISPLISASGVQDPELAVNLWKKFSDDVDGLNVLVSSSYSGSGDPTVASWSELSVTFPPATGAWQVSNVELDSYISGDFYLAFQYESTGTGGETTTAWAVDNVMVTGVAGDDLTPPSFTGAEALSQTEVLLTFSETIAETSAEIEANYSINNGIESPNTATRGYNGNNNQVLLTTSNLVNGTDYTVTVNNLEDLAGNPISANSQQNFSYTVVVDPELFYTETFELGTAGWTLQSSASNSNWELTNSNEVHHPTSVLDGDFYLYMNGYGADAPSEDWLISPQISGAHSNTILSVNLWTKYSDTTPGLSVLYSTDFSGDAEAATWQILPITLPVAGTDSWQVKTVAIPTSRTDFYLGFKYESSGTGGGTTTAWGVDAIQLSGVETGEEIFPPANVEITYSGSNITLNWSSVPGATSYTIYGSSQPDGSYLLIDTVNPGITTLNLSSVDGKKFFYLKANK